MNKEELYKFAIERYGDEAQINQGIEEMAELIQAINKFRRNPCEETLKGIAEEIADVEIMLEQYKIIFGATLPVNRIKSNKLQRLAERLGVKDYD
jgi:NTP pyrophosphatase (non-canonical NTP hydrolase)|nr:MAG TPA: nucleoside triphosphate pyrophosphohydrolase [Caudoviricetes sp.]